MPEETSPTHLITVVLVNRALSYNCVGKLTGWSGVEYGYSVYEEAHGAHVCRMPLAQWRAPQKDEDGRLKASVDYLRAALAFAGSAS